MMTTKGAVMTTQIGLSQRQKAAVIVRLLLDDDQVAGLDRLDSEAQALLAQEMAGFPHTPVRHWFAQTGE